MTVADTPLRQTAHILLRNKLSLFAMIQVLILISLAFAGPWLAPHEPLITNPQNRYMAPSAVHVFGTDQLGRDVLSRCLYAARLDLAIAFFAVVLSSSLGTVVGAICGFFGGWFDRIVGRLVDVMLAFPLFVLAIALVAALGNTVNNIIYATAIINLPFYIRLSRAEVLRLRESQYVESAYLSGHSPVSVMFRIIIPNISPILAVQISLNVGWAMLNAAGLSFIGLGINPPTPEWGIMVAEGAKDLMSGSWWTSLFPGLMLSWAIFSFNLFGDCVRDLLDPRMKS